MNLHERWTLCGSRLRMDLGEEVFGSWFGGLKLEGIDDRHARFTVPTRFLKSWIESHYVDRILAALNSEIGGISGLVIGVRSSTRAPVGEIGPVVIRDCGRSELPSI